ncbi:DUF3105 domain-containing protein [Blastococcus sp. MG754426]|uniref:DUF3105 domain-containing protein n=1 Tax=unclassified Blastococcus TaxID=2619396 RepID=UPI001EF044D3|nr:MULTISPECIES: DUF3105 domain-containing protein [unclassified Blastococcus]MCF6505975.1 DUF3105 domain-containing protein [Blastococcus sp. MG754426]MCF6510638.1 DUF3105 domain-containing protein [Blastococcus sp. MG754427]MCF6733957.1 DUF3105 domain-containing protein [Blastococcus sp. KM273129]
MAKDRTPDKSRATGGGATRSGGRAGGRTRPPTQVVAQQRPWGLIAAAIAVVVFAAAVITYAVVQVREADALRVDSIDEIDGAQVFDYEGGLHDDGPIEYTESPPVGGEHANLWADCTGTVYDVDIRHENAVHSLEHGAVWITYNPDEVSDADVETLAGLVEGVSGRMLSPYEGLDSPISLQSWGHQLKVDSADDERIQQFADLMTYKADSFPEPGATCESPTFLADPLLESDDAPATQ